jgi:CDP-diacylglycerol---glycerol-3-phosphate 3-phosphatidyltransferase
VTTPEPRIAGSQADARFTSAKPDPRAGAARPERFTAAEAQARITAAALRPPPPDPINDPVNRVSNWNIANALTLMRILLVPVFAVVLFTDGGHHVGWRVAAWGVFAVASITDRIDGELARRRHLVTELGKLADPIADKALIGMALIGLSSLGELTWWVTIVILARELAVTGLRFWVIRHGVIPASRGGKVKTLLQAVAIGLYVLPLSGGWRDAAAVTMGAAVVLTVVTGVDYVSRAVSLRRRGRAKQAASRS